MDRYAMERNPFTPASRIPPEEKEKNIPAKKKNLSDIQPIPIKELDIDDRIKQSYLDSGIEYLYPPQSEAIQKGLLDHKNILAAIPTASGKTLLAELAMLKNILAGGKALYIVPLIALANEKYERFKHFNQFGIKCGISTGDLDSKSIKLGENDIIVCTSEKADSLMRNSTPWMGQINCIVVDEVHLLNDPERGPILDITMTKLRHLNPDAQMLGLSATVGNAQEVARWMEAEAIISQWRPTILYEGIHLDGRLIFPESEKRIDRPTPDDAVNIILDTIREGGQCLVFNSSRRNSSAFARNAGKYISSTLGPEDIRLLQEMAEKVLRASDTREAKKLASCIESGAAFHHAGLNCAQRLIVERGFREGVLRIISSTPTLAAGLNLPARRVLIRQYTRYHPEFGSIHIPVLEYKQMAGRAGRPHLDPYGEAIMIAKQEENVQELMEEYIFAEAENIESRLGTQSALRTHVLSCIASGYTTTRQQMLQFMSRTFCACYTDIQMLLEEVDLCIDFLTNYNMVSETDKLKPTTLGILVSRLYVDPLSAALIIEGLKDYKGELTDLTLIHLATHTPDVRTSYFKDNELEGLVDYIEGHENELSLDPHIQSDTDFNELIREIKTSRIMLEWINGTHPDLIMDTYNIYEGDIHNTSSSLQWIMHAIRNISSMMDLGASGLATELELRLKHGVKKELLPLISIRNVGRVRARQLYDAGYTSKKDIMNMDMDDLKKIMGEKTAHNILKDLGKIAPGSRPPEKNKKTRKEVSGQTTLFNF